MLIGKQNIIKVTKLCFGYYYHHIIMNIIETLSKLFIPPDKKKAWREQRNAYLENTAWQVLETHIPPTPPSLHASDRKATKWGIKTA